MGVAFPTLSLPFESPTDVNRVNVSFRVLDICRDQLGIAPSMPPELEPALKRAQEAAKETADDWDRAYRKPWRTVINLKAVKLDEHGYPNEAATMDSLGARLHEGQRIVLEAPAGSGKTTTLVQFARRVLSAGGLPFLVDLPEWVSSHRNILAYIADYPAFGARDLDASLLSKLRGKQPPAFLLNGWNEVSLANAGAADAALRDLEQSFPAATIVVTTRLHRLIPSLRDAFRVQLNQLDLSQRNEYLNLALGEAGLDLTHAADPRRSCRSLSRRERNPADENGRAWRRVGRDRTFNGAPDRLATSASSRTRLRLPARSFDENDRARRNQNCRR